MEINGYQVAILIVGIFDLVGMKCLEFRPADVPAIFWSEKGQLFLELLKIFFALTSWLVLILAFVFLPWYQALLILFLAIVGGIIIRTLLKFEANALVSLGSAILCVIAMAYIAFARITE